MGRRVDVAGHVSFDELVLGGSVEDAAARRRAARENPPPAAPLPPRHARRPRPISTLVYAAAGVAAGGGIGLAGLSIAMLLGVFGE